MKTKIKISNAVQVDAHLNMNSKRAVNAEDALDGQDLTTKEQVEEKISEIETHMKWAGTQW